MERKRLRTGSGLSVYGRRLIAYIVLTLISFFCLFWFYVLFVNATRSNGELQSGFTLIPSTHFLTNWKNLLAGTIPVLKGMLNSMVVSTLNAILCVYFSTMTAYAIHAYDFKLKKYIYPFILMVMMIPSQVTALGFVKLASGMGLEDSFIPLVIPSIAAPLTFFYMKQYMESTLPLSLIEAARIDGANALQVFLKIILPGLRPVLAVTLILDTVWWFKHYTLVWVLTQGGPGDETALVSISIYKQAFDNFNFGSAAAMSVIVFIVCFIVGIVYRRILDED